MDCNRLVHLLNHYLAYPSEAIDIELIDALIYLERWNYSHGFMALAIRSHTYDCKLAKHTPRWEHIAHNLLEAECLRAVRALTISIDDDAIKDRLIDLTLERKGIILTAPAANQSLLRSH